MKEEHYTVRYTVRRADLVRTYRPDGQPQLRVRLWLRREAGRAEKLALLDVGPERARDLTALETRRLLHECADAYELDFPGRRVELPDQVAADVRTGRAAALPPAPYFAAKGAAKGAVLGPVRT